MWMKLRLGRSKARSVRMLWPCPASACMSWCPVAYMHHACVARCVCRGAEEVMRRCYMTASVPVSSDQVDAALQLWAVRVAREGSAAVSDAAPALSSMRAAGCDAISIAW